MAMTKLDQINEKVKSAGSIVDIRLEDWETFCLYFEDGSELEISAGVDWSRCEEFDGLWTEFKYIKQDDNTDKNVNIAYEHKWKD